MFIKYKQQKTIWFGVLDEVNEMNEYWGGEMVLFVMFDKF